MAAAAAAAAFLVQHVRRDWFYLLVSRWLDLTSLCRLDAALTNHAARADWLVQLSRLPSTPLFDNLQFTHAKLRWLVTRGVTSLKALVLDRGGPPGLEEDSFAGCRFPSLELLDLRGHRPSRRQPRRSAPPFHPPASLGQARLSHFDCITGCRPPLRSVSLVGESVQALPQALALLVSRCGSTIDTLELEGCGLALADSALGLLAGLPLLRSLTLQGAGGITDAGLALLLTLPPPPPPQPQPQPQQQQQQQQQLEGVGGGGGGGGAGAGSNSDANANTNEDEAEAGAEAAAAATRRLLSRPPRPLALISLNLSQCSGLGPASLLLLAAACSSLQSLALADCAAAVTDSAVAAVAARSPQLQELWLSRCYRVGDAGLAALHRHCQRLTALHLAGCVNVTGPAAAALRARALPQGEPCAVFV